MGNQQWVAMTEVMRMGDTCRTTSSLWKRQLGEDPKSCAIILEVSVTGGGLLVKAVMRKAYLSGILSEWPILR